MAQRNRERTEDDGLMQLHADVERLLALRKGHVLHALLRPRKPPASYVDLGRAKRCAPRSDIEAT